MGKRTNKNSNQQQNSRKHIDRLLQKRLKNLKYQAKMRNHQLQVVRLHMRKVKQRSRLNEELNRKHKERQRLRNKLKQELNRNPALNLLRGMMALMPHLRKVKQRSKLNGELNRKHKEQQRLRNKLKWELNTNPALKAIV